MEFTAIRVPADEHDEKVIGCPSPVDHHHQPGAVEKEHMFDKVVTPSDVGKLNRLVIPKQHAEKYFPLDGAATDNNKGQLLLSFEDRGGKPWRFRYSYWNSSQSYVMTKGWSRFVKDKRLHAGDTVSFSRGVGDAAARGRLFIDCRRRLVAAFAPWPHTAGGGRMFQLPPSPVASFYDYDAHHRRHVYGELNRQVLVYHPAVVLESVPVRLATAGQLADQPPSGTKRRVRLFGVNLDCANSEEEDLSGGGRTAQQVPSSSSSGKARCSLNLDL